MPNLKDLFASYLVVNTYAYGVEVTVEGTGHGDTNSNPVRG